MFKSIKFSVVIVLCAILAEANESPTPDLWWPGPSRAVVFSDDLVVVGTISPGPTCPTEGPNVYIFDRNTGDLIRTLTGPSRSCFGASLALDGNTLLVGAPFENVEGTYHPNGVVYQYDTVSWHLVQKVLNPASNDSRCGGNEFGRDIALDGELAIIGSNDRHPFYNYCPDIEHKTGLAYVLHVNTGTLKLLQDPTVGMFPYGSGFGLNVAISGRKVLVGAKIYGGDDYGWGPGAVFLMDALTGKILRTFLDPTPNDADQFGQCFDISEDRVLIGAANERDTYLFDSDSGQLLHTLNTDGFGCEQKSLAISKNLAIIGKPADPLGHSPGWWIGAAYLYEMETGTLLNTFSVFDLDPRQDYWGPRFAHAVDFSGSAFVASSLGFNNGEGAVFLFDTNVPPLPPDCSESLQFFKNGTNACAPSLWLTQTTPSPPLEQLPEFTIETRPVEVCLEIETSVNGHVGCVDCFNVTDPVLIEACANPEPQEFEQIRVSLKDVNSGQIKELGVSEDCNGTSQTAQRCGPYSWCTDLEAGTYRIIPEHVLQGDGAQSVGLLGISVEYDSCPAIDCRIDFDGDLDIDGGDLAKLIQQDGQVYLSLFAPQFGNAGCSP